MCIDTALWIVFVSEYSTQCGHDINCGFKMRNFLFLIIIIITIIIICEYNVIKGTPPVLFCWAKRNINRIIYYPSKFEVGKIF